MKPARILLGLLLLMSFAACSSSSDDKEQAMQDARQAKADAAAKDAETSKKHLICPQVAIIHELETVRDYGTEKPDPAQMVAAARMESLDGTCAYQEKGIDITFTLDFLAARGPRLGGNRTEFPYFVAVVDPAGKILNKNQMSAAFKFKEDEKTSSHDEPLHVFIPLSKAQKSTGPDYRVMIGFQLTEDQLKEVRKAEDMAKQNK